MKEEGNPDYVGVGRGRRGRSVEAGYRGRAPRVREELAGMEKEELQVSVVRDFVVWAFFFPQGGGRALTRESFDGLHRPVLVGAVHEGVAGFDQELAAVGDLVLRKYFLQVGWSHALVEVADVKLVHGGGGGAGRGPGKGRTGGRGRRAS